METEDQVPTLNFGVVYLALCKVNGKKYIGQTTKSLDYRKRRHFAQAYKLKYNNLFQLALRKHGWDSFEWSILATCADKNELDAEEIKQIAYHRTTEREFGYNMTSGGTGGAIVEQLANRDEIYRKRAVAIQGEKNGFWGKQHSQETRTLISEIQRGRRQSDESCRKRSETLKGRVFSDSHRAKISAAKTGANNAAYGTRHTEAHKQKISEAMKVYHQSRKGTT